MRPIPEIIGTISEMSGVPEEDILRVHKWTTASAKARAAVCFLAHDKFGHSLASIVPALGGRHKRTIYQAIDVCRNLMDTDQEFAYFVDAAYHRLSYEAETGNGRLREAVEFGYNSGHEDGVAFGGVHPNGYRRHECFDSFMNYLNAGEVDAVAE